MGISFTILPYNATPIKESLARMTAHKNTTLIETMQRKMATKENQQNLKGLK